MKEKDKRCTLDTHTNMICGVEGCVVNAGCLGAAKVVPVGPEG